MKPICLIPVLCLLVVALGGCMSQNTDDCPTADNVRLYFRYEDSDRAFADQIGEVGIYVLDGDRQLVTYAMLDRDRLSRFAGADFTLTPGDYSVVCWGNIQTDAIRYSDEDGLPGVSAEGQAVFYAPKQTTLDPYAGDTYETFSLTVPRTGTVEKTLDFMAAHRTVSVYVKGMTDRDASGTNLAPRVELTGIPAGYDYRLTLFSETTSYTRTAAISDELAATVFHTPYFQPTDAIEIRVRKQSDDQLLQTVNLREFCDAQGIDPGLNGPIEIWIEFKDGSFVISIPNWGDDDIKPEF